MNANQTSDSDGTDELNIFQVSLYKNQRFIKYLMNEDISGTTYEEGWSQSFRDLQTDFMISKSCFLRFYVEEQDSGSVQSCTVDTPCTDTMFSYAPCMLVGDNDSSASNDKEHGYYVITFQVEPFYEMEDWPYCDIAKNCVITLFGIGVWCYEF